MRPPVTREQSLKTVKWHDDKGCEERHDECGDPRKDLEARGGVDQDFRSDSRSQGPECQIERKKARGFGPQPEVPAMTGLVISHRTQNPTLEFTGQTHFITKRGIDVLQAH